MEYLDDWWILKEVLEAGSGDFIPEDQGVKDVVFLVSWELDKAQDDGMALNAMILEIDS